MKCSPSGSSVHGILQARILEWVSIPFSRGSSRPSIKPMLTAALALQADSLPLEPQVERIYLPMQETQESWVQSLGWEDPLEKGMAIHSSILAWRIPWREEPGGLQSMGSQESDMTEATNPTNILEHPQILISVEGSVDTEAQLYMYRHKNA